MRRFVGPAVLVIGMLHILFVFATMRTPLVAIGRAGVFDAIGSHLDREAAFWSFWFGVLLATLGYLIHWIAARGQPVPALAGWVLVGLGVGGGVLMPVGPFWIAIPLGWLVLAPFHSSQFTTAFTASPQFGPIVGSRWGRGRPHDTPQAPVEAKQGRTARQENRRRWPAG